MSAARTILAVSFNVQLHTCIYKGRMNNYARPHPVLKKKLIINFAWPGNRYMPRINCIQYMVYMYVIYHQATNRDIYRGAALVVGN